MKEIFEKKLNEGFDIKVNYSIFLNSSYEPYCNINLVLKPNKNYFLLKKNGIYFDLNKIQIFVPYKKITCYKFEKSIS